MQPGNESMGPVGGWHSYAFLYHPYAVRWLLAGGLDKEVNYKGIPKRGLRNYKCKCNKLVLLLILAAISFKNNKKILLKIFIQKDVDLSPAMWIHHFPLMLEPLSHL